MKRYGYGYGCTINKSSGGGGSQIYPVNSATLNGTSQYYSAGNKYNLSNQNFGFAGWFRFNNTATSQFLFGKYQASTNDQSYYFYWSNVLGAFIFDTSTTGTGVTKGYSHSFTPTDGVWYHIAVVREANTYKLYIDTVLVHSEAMTDNLFTSSASFEWGGISSSSLFAQVNLFAVNNVVGDSYTQSDLSAMYSGDDVANCYTSLPQALKDKFTAYNRLGNFNGNAGEETDDQSGNGNNLTSIGSPTYTDQGLQVEC